MITKLNLASKPFRNRTLPYMISLLLLAFAVAGAVLSFAKLSDINKRNELAKSDIEQMQTEVQALKGKGEKVQQQLTPEQRDLLVASHKLVANKSFGWSRLFADLESLLPGGVSVSRISVQEIYKDGDKTKADLEFGVLSRDYQSVMTMIDNMNSSGIFQAELRGQDLQKTERLTYTEYTLRLIYTPRYSYSPTQSDVAQTNGGNQ
ncbi:MAG: PilN domain-containing protein [Pyrinomonadaceae bacterium]